RLRPRRAFLLVAPSGPPCQNHASLRPHVYLAPPARTWANGGATVAKPHRPLQEPKFAGPVGQRPAQSLDVWMAGADLGFDHRNLAAAFDNSCGHLLALLSNLLECPPVAIQRG